VNVPPVLWTYFQAQGAFESFFAPHVYDKVLICATVSFAGEDMTRRKLEQTFGLIHYVIIETGIIALSIIGLWHLFHSH
jgi:fumarate reductase subunit D